MVRFEIVAIGASTGGVRALAGLLVNIPTKFTVPIAIVQHQNPTIKAFCPRSSGRSATYV